MTGSRALIGRRIAALGRVTGSRALIETRIAALDAATIEIWRARAALEIAHKKYIQRCAELERSLAKAPIEKVKLGRPEFWRGQGGLSFVLEIKMIRKQKRCNIGMAISVALKNPLNAHLKKYDPEQLKQRYQEARAYWAFSLNPGEYTGHARWAALERAKSALDAAVERHRLIYDRLAQSWPTYSSDAVAHRD